MTRLAEYRYFRWLEKYSTLRHRAVESFVVALFLASLSLLLECAGLLDWLDVAMLHIVPETVRPEPTRSVAPEILVLTIEPRFFETEFGGQSPIPRGAFTKLLKKLDTTFPPNVLAIDYDLSPGCTHLKASDPQLQCGQWLGRDAGEHEILTTYLRSRQRPIVLIEPLPINDPVVCETRWRWVDETRAHGTVTFGDHHLVHHGFFDTVVKYEENPRSFAHQALCTAQPQQPTCTKDGAPTSAEHTPQCATPPVEGRLHLLNFLHAAAGGVRICRLWRLASVEDCAAIHGTDFRIVFVGGNSDSGDRFITPMGPKSGVELHAHIAFSMMKGHGLAPRHLYALLLDTFLGTVAGIFLSLSWGKHYATDRPAVRLGRALVSFGVLVVAGVIPFLPARWFMLRGMWINPGPMLIGLFVKSWHASVIGDESRHVGDDGRHRPAIQRRWQQRGDRTIGALYCVVWIGVVVLALYTIVVIGEPSGSH